MKRKTTPKKGAARSRRAKEPDSLERLARLTRPLLAVSPEEIRKAEKKRKG